MWPALLSRHLEGANGPHNSFWGMKKKANSPAGEIGLNQIALLFREENPLPDFVSTKRETTHRNRKCF
jgi:hypothetical protein